MSNPEVPNSNGMTTDPMQRLPSLKTPRDLSLGGIKSNKKVFIPNLNVTRNKNKGPTPVNARDNKKDNRNRRDRQNDKNRNFQKNGPNVIKSSGVFSDGLGASERHTSRSYFRDVDSAPSIQKPTIRVKDVIKIDKELEEQKIRTAFGANIGDEVEEDFKEILDKDAPIKLPMDDGGSVKPKPAVKVKQEVTVKKEPDEDIDCSIVTVDKKPLVDVKTALYEDTDVVNVLRSDKPTLILLQLPDSLPGRGGSADDDSSSGSREDKPVDNRCRLADLEEGKIGKLLIHRSGRVSLALGDTLFQVSTGTKSAFHQEVVSLAVDDGSRSANLVALGPIQHKLNLMPDWETMFQDMLV